MWPDCTSQVGHFTYEGRGAYAMNKHKGVATHLSMLAGGTGAPLSGLPCSMLQGRCLNVQGALYAMNPSLPHLWGSELFL